MNKNTKIIYSDTFIFASAITNQSLPVYDPSLSFCFFGSSHLTQTVSQLYKFSFNYSFPLNLSYSSFPDVPNTYTNNYIIFILSTKTCSNPIAYLSRSSFQCQINGVYNCTP